MTRVIALVVATLVVAMSFNLFAGSAAAHERRNVGPYLFVVGWINEPAFQGQPNAATVRISDTRVSPAKAVEGLEKALSIQVFSGGLTNPFTGTTRSVFGQPGLYALDVIPTVAGGYKYRISGKIDTLDVNETFESGPSTFNDVEGAGELQYPTKVPAGDDLSGRLADIQSAIDQTRLFALAALVVGIVALGGAFIGRRRT